MHDRVSEELAARQRAALVRYAEERVRNLVLLHIAQDLDVGKQTLRDRMAGQHYQLSSTVSPHAITARYGSFFGTAPVLATR